MKQRSSNETKQHRMMTELRVKTALLPVCIDVSKPLSIPECGNHTDVVLFNHQFLTLFIGVIAPKSSSSAEFKSTNVTFDISQIMQDDSGDLVEHRVDYLPPRAVDASNIKNTDTLKSSWSEAGSDIVIYASELRIKSSHTGSLQLNICTTFQGCGCKGISENASAEHSITCRLGTTQTTAVECKSFSTDGGSILAQVLINSECDVRLVIPSVEFCFSQSTIHLNSSSPEDPEGDNIQITSHALQKLMTMSATPMALPTGNSTWGDITLEPHTSLSLIYKFSNLSGIQTAPGYDKNNQTINIHTPVRVSWKLLDSVDSSTTNPFQVNVDWMIPLNCPITMNIAAPQDRVEVGTKFYIGVTLSNNSTEPLRNVTLELDATVAEPIVAIPLQTSVGVGELLPRHSSVPIQIEFLAVASGVFTLRNLRTTHGKPEKVLDLVNQDAVQVLINNKCA